MGERPSYFGVGLRPASAQPAGNSCVHLATWFRTYASATPADSPYVGGLPHIAPRKFVGPGDLVQRDCRAD